MIPVIPWYFTLIVLATNLTVAAAVWRIFAAGAARSGLPPDTERKARIGIALFLGAWLGAALLLAPAPASLAARDRFYLTPLIPLFAVAGLGTALVALWRSPALRRVLDAASLPAMIGVQLYRTIGVVFLVLLAQRQLPAHFALPAGWGDIAVGAAAPLVALALARGMTGALPLAVAWNALGLLDLVVAVGMGTGFLAPLLAPELGSHVPPAAAMGAFPMILVPAFAVPVSVLLHLLALMRLRHEARLGSHRMAASPAR
jgi:hypothetical protein